MEESVAPASKSGRRTTHQFALRPGCLFIYGLIKDGAWVDDVLLLRLGVETSFMFERDERRRTRWLCVVMGFRRDVDEICALLGHYAAYSGNSLLTFLDNLSVPF
jgi:hypothetical protein